MPFITYKICAYSLSDADLGLFDMMAKNPGYELDHHRASTVPTPTLAVVCSSKWRVGELTLPLAASLKHLSLIQMFNDRTNFNKLQHTHKKRTEHVIKRWCFYQVSPELG